MYKYLFLFTISLFLTQCSLDTKTGFWTKDIIKEEKKDVQEEIFKSQKVLDREFNPNLKIRIDSPYKQAAFINNLSNNIGYLNFNGNFKEKSKFKFKRIKKFDLINPDLLISKDNSIIFFDEKGSIVKFSSDSNLIWKKNHYEKSEIKLKPSISFASDKNILVAADTIANIYAMDLFKGELIWKNRNPSPFNSEIKIYGDKIFLIDFENIIRCISLESGKEIWSFGTDKTYIKSQRKLSLIIHKEIVIFIDTMGDINALDIKTGNLIWQSQTVNEAIFENTFLLKTSKLVLDDQTIYVSNNQNNFFAIDYRNGNIKWKQSVNSYLDPSVIGNLVFTVTEEGYFIIIDKSNGNILRSTNILEIIKKKNIYPTGFIAAKNFIYVSLSNGRLLKVSIEDGKTKNIIKIDGGKISRPYILNKTMYILRNDAIIKVE